MIYCNKEDCLYRQRIESKEKNFVIYTGKCNISPSFVFSEDKDSNPLAVKRNALCMKMQMNTFVCKDKDCSNNCEDKCIKENIYVNSNGACVCRSSCFRGHIDFSRFAKKKDMF